MNGENLSSHTDITSNRPCVFRFKTACRALGLPNWPYRRRKSVHALLENIAGEEHAEEVVEILRAEDAALLREPSKGLCHNFKRLRQAFYKEKYKERKNPSPTDN